MIRDGGLSDCRNFSLQLPVKRPLDGSRIDGDICCCELSFFSIRVPIMRTFKGRSSIGHFLFNAGQHLTVSTFACTFEMSYGYSRTWPFDWTTVAVCKHRRGIDLLTQVCLTLPQKVVLVPEMFRSRFSTCHVVSLILCLHWFAMHGAGETNPTMAGFTWSLILRL